MSAARAPREIAPRDRAPPHECSERSKRSERPGPASDPAAARAVRGAEGEEPWGQGIILKCILCKTERSQALLLSPRDKALS